MHSQFPFTKRWESRRETQTAPSGGPQPTSAAEPAAVAALPAPEAGAGKAANDKNAKGKGKGKRGKERGKDGEMPPSKTPKINGKALAAAKRAKALYGSSIAQASAIRGSITSAADWQWANHQSLYQALDDAVQALDELVRSSPFMQKVLTGDFNDAKKTMPPHEFETELVRFTESLDVPCNRLSKECRLLMATHTARANTL